MSPVRSPWRRQLQRQVGSITKQRAPSRTSPRQNAQRLTNSSVPPFVHVWLVFLRSLAATKGSAPEHVATLKTYWDVVKSSPVAAHVRHCQAKPCRKIEGKEGWARIVFCLDPVTLPLEPALEAALLLQKGIRKRGSAPRGTPRDRSIEASGTDAGEVERVARRLEDRQSAHG